MAQFRDVSPADRLAAASTAKTATLARFLARPGPDDPAVIERRAAQVAIAEARAVRAAERAMVQEAAAARRAAEVADALAQKAVAAAELAAAEVLRNRDAAQTEADYKARALALAAEQKAARDAKYAKRKAR